MSLNELSEQLLLAVKSEESVVAHLRQLHATPTTELYLISSDEQKIAFWVNCYNAWYQILRTQRGIAKSKIYTIKQIEIAGLAFSLDDIEHGILRRFRFKYGAGYLPNPFASRLIKDLAVTKVDWRIHFALNCGAKSCPPIAFYTVDRLDQQLDMATASHLASETDVKQDKKEIHVTKLFRWFAADFGGRAGTLALLAERLKIETDGYRLVYKPYSWDEQLAHFASESDSQDN